MHPSNVFVGFQTLKPTIPGHLPSPKNRSKLVTWNYMPLSVEGFPLLSLLRSAHRVSRSLKFNSEFSPEKWPKPKRKPERLPFPSWISGENSLLNFGSVMIAHGSWVEHVNKPLHEMWRFWSVPFYSDGSTPQPRMLARHQQDDGWHFEVRCVFQSKLFVCHDCILGGAVDASNVFP